MLWQVARQGCSRRFLSPRCEVIDVAELYGSYSRAELKACEELGFGAYGEGGPLSVDEIFAEDGELPVNTSAMPGLPR